MKRTLIPWPVAAALFLSLPAWAGLSEWMTDPGGHPHPEYPKDEYYCDVGTSPDNREAARQSAVAAVARQVRSEVKSSTSVDLKQQIDAQGVVVGGGSNSSSSVSVETYFQRADLIRFVGEERHKKQDYVYACLDLAQAVRALSNDITPSLAKFSAGLEQAQSAWEAKDIAGFTPSYRAAVDAYQGVAISASILNTLSAGSSEAAIVSDGIQWLNATRVQAISGVRIALDVQGEGLDTTHTKAVSEQVQAVLSDMGFIVGGSCSAGAANVWAVEVDVAAASKYTSFGRYQIHPKLEVSLRDCSRADEPIRGLVESSEMVGQHQDEAKAMDTAIGTITAARIAPGLGDMIVPVFPVNQ